jgi:hypothetical protein
MGSGFDEGQKDPRSTTRSSQEHFNSFTNYLVNCQVHATGDPALPQAHPRRTGSANQDIIVLISPHTLGKPDSPGN